VYSWNFGVEQQITRQTAIRINYVGSHAYHLSFNTDPNSIPSQICSDAAGCLGGGVNAYTVTKGVPSLNAVDATTGLPKGAGIAPQGARYIPIQPYRPNPNLTYGLFLFSNGVQSYNGLQTELVQRLARGVQFRANYTWSHNFDTGSAVIGTVARDDSPHYATNQGISNYREAAFDVRHAFHANFSYELPFGQGKPLLGGVHGLTNKLIGGWQLNGIMTFLSGFPITPLTGSNRSGSGDQNNPDRPNWTPSGNI